MVRLICIMSYQNSNKWLHNLHKPIKSSSEIHPEFLFFLIWKKKYSRIMVVLEIWEKAWLAWEIKLKFIALRPGILACCTDQ